MGKHLALTGYCQYQFYMVYWYTQGGVGGVVYCAIVVQ